MSDMQLKIEIRKESKKRVGNMKLGDPITNICAGDSNPQRHAWFVRLDARTHTNKFGIKHVEYSVRKKCLR